MNVHESRNPIVDPYKTYLLVELIILPMGGGSSGNDDFQNGQDSSDSQVHSIPPSRKSATNTVKDPSSQDKPEQSHSRWAKSSHSTDRVIRFAMLATIVLLLLGTLFHVFMNKSASGFALDVRQGLQKEHDSSDRELLAIFQRRYDQIQLYRREDDVLVGVGISEGFEKFSYTPNCRDDTRLRRLPSFDRGRSYTPNVTGLGIAIVNVRFDFDDRMIPIMSGLLRVQYPGNETPIFVRILGGTELPVICLPTGNYELHFFDLIRGCKGNPLGDWRSGKCPPDSAIHLSKQFVLRPGAVTHVNFSIPTTNLTLSMEVGEGEKIPIQTRIQMHLLQNGTGYPAGSMCAHFYDYCIDLRRSNSHAMTGFTYVPPGIYNVTIADSSRCHIRPSMLRETKTFHVEGPTDEIVFRLESEPIIGRVLTGVASSTNDTSLCLKIHDAEERHVCLWKRYLDTGDLDTCDHFSKDEDALSCILAPVSMGTPRDVCPHLHDNGRRQRCNELANEFARPYDFYMHPIKPDHDYNKYPAGPEHYYRLPTKKMYTSRLIEIATNNNLGLLCMTIQNKECLFKVINATGNTVLCRYIPSWWDYNECRAIAMNDPKLCFRYQGGIREECVKNVGVGSLTPEMCENLPRDSETDSCYETLDFLRALPPGTLCARIKSVHDREECYDSIIERMWWKCEEIQDRLLYQRCRIGGRLKGGKTKWENVLDLTCSELTSDVERDLCNAAIGIQKEIPTQCEIVKDRCLSTVAIRTNNDSICHKVESLELQDECYRGAGPWIHELRRDSDRLGFIAPLGDSSFSLGDCIVDVAVIRKSKGQSAIYSGTCRVSNELNETVVEDIVIASPEAKVASFHINGAAINARTCYVGEDALPCFLLELAAGQSVEVSFEAQLDSVTRLVFANPHIESTYCGAWDYLIDFWKNQSGFLNLTIVLPPGTGQVIHNRGSLSGRFNQEKSITYVTRVVRNLINTRVEWSDYEPIDSLGRFYGSSIVMWVEGGDYRKLEDYRIIHVQDFHIELDSIPPESVHVPVAFHDDNLKPYPTFRDLPWYLFVNNIKLTGKKSRYKDLTINLTVLNGLNKYRFVMDTTEGRSLRKHPIYFQGKGRAMVSKIIDDVTEILIVLPDNAVALPKNVSGTWGSISHDGCYEYNGRYVLQYKRPHDGVQGEWEFVTHPRGRLGCTVIPEGTRTRLDNIKQLVDSLQWDS